MTQPLPDIATRAQVLADAGHTWMDPQLQATVLASTQTPDQTLGVANVLRQAWNSSLNPLSALTEDPVLHKQPTLGLQVHQFLTDSIGYLPVAEPDLTVIQRNLQRQGFGATLPTDGVWSSGWHDQWIQAYQQHVEDQIKGNKPGSFTFSRAAHGFLSALLPSHAIPAIVGAVKAIPGGLRDLATELAGDVGATAYDITHPAGFVPGSDTAHEASQFGAGWAQTVQSALGKHQNVTQVQADESRRFVNSISTLLAIAPLAKVGSAAWDAAGTAAARGAWKPLTAEEAARGPGVIAKMMYRPVTNEAGQTTVRGFVNTPGLRMLYPAARDLIGTTAQPGKFYVMRAVMTPYRIPAAGTALSALANAGVQGGVVRGIGAAGNAIVPGDTGLGESIYAQHPITGLLGHAVDALTMFARGAPIGEVDPSKTVSEAAGGARVLLNDALGPVGVRGAYELGTGEKFDDLARRIGNVDDAEWVMRTKVTQFAAAKYAQQQIQGKGLVGQEWEDAFLNAMREAKADPVKLREGMEALTASPVQMAKAFFNDYNHIISDPRSEYANGAGSMVQAWHQVEDILTNHGDQLITPAVRDLVEREKVFSSTPEQVNFGREFVTANHPGLRPQDLGVARDDYQDAGKVAGKASELFARYRRIGPAQSAAADSEISLHEMDALTDGAASRMAAQQPRTAVLDPAQMADEERQIRVEAYQYLTRELHRDPHQLDGLDTPQLIGQVARLAKRQAALVPIPLDADPVLAAKVKALGESGWKMVYGRDIGLQYAHPVIDPVVIDGELAWRKRMAGLIGANLDPVKTGDQAAFTHAAVERSWQKAINDGKVNALPGYDAAAMFTHAVRNLETKAELSGASRIAYEVGRKSGAFKAMARSRLAAQGLEETPGNMAQAYRDIEAMLAKGTSVRDVSFKQFSKAIRTPAGGITQEVADTLGAPAISEADARTYYSLYLKAMAQRPAWMMGLSKAEDMLRASMTPLGKAADVPVIGSPLERLAFLPNDLARLRDQWRFMLSPTFSARRVVKTMLKMGLDGMTPTWRPYEAMVNQGTLNDDLRLLDRVFPELADQGAGFDSMDRFLWQSDLYGWFNPRHFMAYGAGELYRNGVTDLGALRARLDHAFTYGDRTALERSAGMVFYPLSFNKTLYRNLGGWLLDHPGARYAAAQALVAYDALDKHAHFGDFMKAHLPLINELNMKFNAFEHGVNPGMVGGLNAPYIGAFLGLLAPKHFSDGSDQNYKLLTAMVPMLNDLNKMLVGYDPNTRTRTSGLVTQQAGIGMWQALNWADDVRQWVTGDKRSPLNPQHPAISLDAQNERGWQLRNALVAKLGPVIAFNYHQAPDQRVVFPASIPGVGGQPINKTTVGALVQRFYPAFDPTAAAKIAQDKAYQRSQFLNRLPDNARGNAYRTFTKLSDKVQGYVQRDAVDPRTLGALTLEFRTVASNMAEQDPQFLSYWNTYMRPAWGPLQDVVY